ncbi:MAG: anti-sigma factor [Actinobacteria bacterium]|nr:anti-sigma factor [Micrococcales bacterium]MCB0903733.1 anti-sigma factor [Actinomycetota bacterium]MCO5299544.1 anti-sigma factor [Candidatus Nanopelagicales bacterium]MCB9428136.1 anti-sigma factor [Actinomycetota bacterium]HPE13264.1 anti-sigma factor [Actinomycetota bacterium]
MTESIHLLVGPYVLDALDDTETIAFEEHLRGCEDCRQEVSELRETAALLGSAQAGDDVADLKATVMGQVSRTAQLPPQVRGAHGKPRVGRSLGWLAAAAAAVVALVLVGNVREQQQKITAMNEHTTEVMALITADDAKVMPLALPDSSSTVVVSMQRNEAMVMAQDLPAPSEGMVYQTWAYDSAGNATPAGTWMPDEGGYAAAPLTTPVSDCAAISVTEEPSGGSAQPTSEPLAMVEF